MAMAQGDPARTPGQPHYPKPCRRPPKMAHCSRIPDSCHCSSSFRGSSEFRESSTKQKLQRFVNSSRGYLSRSHHHQPSFLFSLEVLQTPRSKYNDCQNNWWNQIKRRIPEQKKTKNSEISKWNHKMYANVKHQYLWKKEVYWISGFRAVQTIFTTWKSVQIL